MNCDELLITCKHLEVAAYIVVSPSLHSIKEISWSEVSIAEVSITEVSNADVSKSEVSTTEYLSTDGATSMTDKFPTLTDPRIIIN